MEIQNLEARLARAEQVLTDVAQGNFNLNIEIPQNGDALVSLEMGINFMIMDLRVMADENKTTENVLLGKQQELVPILSASDLMLMPSQSESFGLAALEAMACEVPVISSSVGGLPELQVHGATGYIDEIGDIGRMARYAIELLGNDVKMNLFRASCRARAVEHFDVKHIVTMYEAYYAECLEKPTPGRAG